MIGNAQATYDNTHVTVDQSEKRSVFRSRRLEPLSIPCNSQYQYTANLANPEIPQDTDQGPPRVPPRARRARQGTFFHGDELSDSSDFSASTVRSKASWETSPSSTEGSPEVTQKPDILSIIPVHGGTNFSRRRACPTPELSTGRNSSALTESSSRSSSLFPQAYTPPVHRGAMFSSGHPIADRRLLTPMPSLPQTRPVASNACDRLSNTELETIKAEIRDQARGFAILPYDEASTLSSVSILLNLSRSAASDP